MTMNKNVYYKMRAEDPDPRNSGDTHSWFFFYKWRAGDTWVPAKDGCMDAVVGDHLVFEMDGQHIGYAAITNIVERNLNDEKELHFNSDEIVVPTLELVFKRLSEIAEGEEPQWLKSLLTRKPK